ncbi:sugar nucleotide-binding protein, partial [Turicibacter sanguinis]|nr:sugar nucleotide-binding protein [Turicibacter sanguinis]
VYGANKLKEEPDVQEILDKFGIICISWVFSKSGNNLIKTILRLI